MWGEFARLLVLRFVVVGGFMVTFVSLRWFGLAVDFGFGLCILVDVSGLVWFLCFAWWCFGVFFGVLVLLVLLGGCGLDAVGL